MRECYTTVEYCNQCPNFFRLSELWDKCKEGVDLSNVEHTNDYDIIIPSDCPLGYKA